MDQKIFPRRLLGSALIAFSCIAVAACQSNEGKTDAFSNRHAPVLNPRIGDSTAIYRKVTGNVSVPDAGPAPLQMPIQQSFVPADRHLPAENERILSAKSPGIEDTRISPVSISTIASPPAPTPVVVAPVVVTPPAAVPLVNAPSMVAAPQLMPEPVPVSTGDSGQKMPSPPVTIKPDLPDAPVVSAPVPSKPAAVSELTAVLTNDKDKNPAAISKNGSDLSGAAAANETLNVLSAPVPLKPADTSSSFVPFPGYKPSVPAPEVENKPSGAEASPILRKIPEDSLPEKPAVASKPEPLDKTDEEVPSPIAKGDLDLSAATTKPDPSAVTPTPEAAPVAPAGGFFPWLHHVFNSDGGSR